MFSVNFSMSLSDISLGGVLSTVRSIKIGCFGTGVDLKLKVLCTLDTDCERPIGVPSDLLLRSG